MLNFCKLVPVAFLFRRNRKPIYTCFILAPGRPLSHIDFATLSMHIGYIYDLGYHQPIEYIVNGPDKHT